MSSLFHRNAGRMRQLLAALTVALALLFQFLVLTSTKAEATQAPYRIAVLGDSYSAGNGAGNYYGAKGCYRSYENFGEKYADRLAALLPAGTDVQVITEACSGAVTADYWKSKQGRRPERKALTMDVDLVLMSFGGNDLGFGDAVTRCLVGATDNPKKCASKLVAASTVLGDGTLGKRLHDLLLDASKLTRPEVKIVLVGYPYLEIDRDLTFGQLDLGAKLYTMSDQGEKVQREVVTALNAETPGDRFVFVSRQELFAGRSTWLSTQEQVRHELYKERVNEDRWMVHPIWDASVATMPTYYHPNPTGWTRTAELLSRTPQLDPRPKILTQTVPEGIVQVAYRSGFRVEDGRPGTWSVNSSHLPPGISLAANGELSGVPSEVGSWQFTVQFTDERWGMTAIRNITMAVGSAPPGNPKAVALAAGIAHTCALTDAGSVYCWGWNNHGQLGDGSIVESSSTPVRVQGLPAPATAITVGGSGAEGTGGPVGSRACALLSTGAVMCWGFGQLVDGVRMDTNFPVQVPGLTSGVVAIGGGEGHDCAVMDNGTVKCWGWNRSGVLGPAVPWTGVIEWRGDPVEVPNLTNVTAVAGGIGHTCVLTSGGAVLCWGGGFNGELGSGSFGASATPVPVVGLGSQATELSAGPMNTCARLATGNLMCWGANDHGQLGDGTTTPSAVPVAPVGIVDDVVSSVDTGPWKTCAQMATGNVSCWGHKVGPLWVDEPAITTTPVPVVGLTGPVVSVSAGSGHICAALVSGQVMCWGSGTFGALGNGSEASSRSPVTVAGLG